MSVPPVSSSLQVPVGKSDSVPAPVALTSDTTDNTFSSGPVLPASYFVRDSDYSIWGFDCPPGRAEGLSVFPVSWNYSGDTRDPQTSDVSQSSDVSQDFEVIIPCRTTTADPRPYPRLVDPTAVTLPLHSTPMDEASGMQGWLGTQHVSPVFGNLPTGRPTY